MTAAPTLSIVVPAYNEEARLRLLIEGLSEAAPRCAAAAGLSLVEAVVVDDGSTDQTVPMLAAAAREHPILRPLLRGTANEGKGAAIRAGIAVARGELVLIADVDLATPFIELVKLHDRVLAGADIAIASRDLPDSTVNGAPRHRVVIGRTFNRTVRALTGLRLRDTQCGFKLLRTADACELLAEQIVRGFAFDVELLMRARVAGLRIDEVPVRYDHGADSTVNPLRAGPRMGWDVLRVAVALRRDYAGAASRAPTHHPDRDSGR